MSHKNPGYPLLSKKPEDLATMDPQEGCWISAATLVFGCVLSHLLQTPLVHPTHLGIYLVPGDTGVCDPRY